MKIGRPLIIQKLAQKLLNQSRFSLILGIFFAFLFLKHFYPKIKEESMNTITSSVKLLDFSQPQFKELCVKFNLQPGLVNKAMKNFLIFLDQKKKIRSLIQQTRVQKRIQLLLWI